MENLVQHVKGYEIKERIGAGGFGAVYRAYQPRIEREVAIKVILPDVAKQPDFIRRFEVEAQLVACLEHMNIVPLYDYWRDPEGAYLIMRYLRGGSLADRLKQGACDLQTVGKVLTQIAAALHVAHRNNIIHRDIKPANILLDDEGNAYLTDFGIAKDNNRIDGSATAADAIIGSLDYISPEQARSETVTPKTDIYSLGVVLYEMLTGQHPFPDITSVERLYKHINDPLPDITDIPPKLMDAVNQVVQIATAKKPDQRYDDVMVFANAFLKAAQLKQQPMPESLVELLSPREQEILQLMINGLSNREIAEQLVITISTVKATQSHIYRKLRVKNRVQAISRGRELDLLYGEAKPSHNQHDTSLSLIAMLPEPENPYKGLQAFQSTDSQDFFGREDITTKLVSRLDENTQWSRFLAVIGPSGSGKSSLVRAGLIPAIWRGELTGSDRWFTVEMIPGSHPLEELEVALRRISSHPGRLMDDLESDPRGLLRATQLILPEDDSELVLVIDQFEEVFTLVEDEAQRIHFLKLLYTTATDPRSRVQIIVTLRADFYDRPLRYLDFGEMLRNRMETIMPLSADELERAIVNPVARMGIKFEDGLVASIIDEVSYQPGALPLLQYALTELFEQRNNRMLTRQAYQDIGGTVGALAKRADELFTEFNHAGQMAIHQMFLRLVTLGEGVEDTRRRTLRNELLDISVDMDIMDEVIDTYAIYRLLSLDHDPANRQPTVEVAHEAILREWDRLRNWINEAREEIKMQQQLSRMAEEWEHAQQDPSYLASGLRLEQLEGWAEETQLALTETEQIFLDASIDERNRRRVLEEVRKEREAGLEQRSVQRLRLLVAVFALATILSIGLSAFAFDREQQAQSSRETSDANLIVANRRADEIHSLSLVTNAQQVMNVDPELALALALEANNLPDAPKLAQQYLPEAANVSRAIRHIPVSDQSVEAIAVSPDGQRVIVGTIDGSLMLVNPFSGEMIRQFEGHNEAVESVDYSSSGQYILSGSRDDTLVIWDVETGEMIYQFVGHEGNVNSVVFSSDDQTILSGSGDNSLILWDVTTGDILRRFESHSSKVTSVAFSPDGGSAISASNDKTLLLWDIATGEVIQRLEGHKRIVQIVAFNPSGTRVASGSSDNTILVWDIQKGTIVARFLGHEETVTSLAFSPDGQTLFSGYTDGTLIVWNPWTDKIIHRFIGHKGSVNTVDFLPNNQMALSGSFDNSMTLWDLDTGIGEINRFEGHDAHVMSVAVSPDGNTILGGGGLWVGGEWISAGHIGADSILILWDVKSGEILRRFEGHTGSVWEVEFSPDGQQALSASADKTLILWDLDTGKILQRLEGHTRPVFSVNFSKDGRRAVSSSEDNSTILWDLTTGKPIRTFQGQGGEILDVEFSPDETMILSAGGSLQGDAILWDIETGEIIQQFADHRTRVVGVAFHPDGQRIMTASSDWTMILWDIVTGDVIREFQGHTYYVLKVTFSPDGQTALSSGNDGDAILWDVETGTIIQRFSAHDDSVMQVDFSPDGDWAVSSSTDGTVRMWHVDPDGLIKWIEDNRYVREFTCEEREQYRIEPLCEEE